MNYLLSLKNLSWHVRYSASRLRSHHIIASGLFAFISLTLVIIDYPLYVETRTLSSRLATRTRTPAPARPQTLPNNPSRDTVKSFTASLPEYRKYAEQLRGLFNLASKSETTVNRVDYKYETIADLPIQKLTLRVDLIGKKFQQRKFLQAALNTFKNLSISRLAYSKGAEAAAGIEMKLEINLYYRLDKVPA